MEKAKLPPAERPSAHISFLQSSVLSALYWHCEIVVTQRLLELDNEIIETNRRSERTNTFTFRAEPSGLRAVSDLLENSFLLGRSKGLFVGHVDIIFLIYDMATL